MADILYYKTEIKTSVGNLTLIGSEKGLYAVLWEKDKLSRVRLPSNLSINNNYSLFIEAEKQLTEYLDGKRSTFDLKLDLSYGTTFQQSAWKALMDIPYGNVRSYGEQAKIIGNAKASRAVGTANGKNPLSIIVPCHRVIAGSGKLGGFAGGLDVKQKLLDLELLYK